MSYRLRILHIISGLSTGGAERALHSLLTGGLAKDFDSMVVSLGSDGTYGRPIREAGVPVQALNLRGPFDFISGGGRLRRIVKSFKPDLIQGWMYHGNLAASIAGAMIFPSTPPFVLWNVRHSLYQIRKEKRATRQVIRANRLLSAKPVSLIYNSQKSRRLHEDFGFEARRSVVIPNGFDTDRLSSNAIAKADARRFLGITDESLVLGHVARFHTMKDHPRFLRVAVQIARSNPETRFVLIGRNVGLQNTALEQIIPLDLRRQFIFMGERSDVYFLMCAMDILCMSSAWGEAFPNVLGEAMALGVPCLATDVGDSADIVGTTGIVVPPSSDRALFDGMSKFVNMSASERRSRGELARERIVSKFGLTSIVNEYVRLYNELGRSVNT